METATIEAPPSADGLSQIDIGNWADQLGIKEFMPAEEATPAQDIPAAPESVTPPETVTPPAAEKPKNESLQRRLTEKELKQQLEDLRKEREELASKAAKLPELETSVTEFRTLAEQRAAKVKELEDAYRNEGESLSPELIDTLPEVVQAREKFNSVSAGLFPRNVSDPDSGEAAVRFDPSKFTGQKAQIVRDSINRWEQEDANPSPDASLIQHIVLSNIALAAGVKPEHFDEVEFGGKTYKTIRPSHPFHRHLESKMPDYVEERAKFNAAYSTAAQNKQQTYQSAISQKIENTKALYKKTGVGVTGDELKSLLTKAPEDLNLKTMSLLEGHPDLLAELNSQIELEASTNGVFRPNLDIFEADPGKRTAAANAHMQRIYNRAVKAPVAEVAQKLALRLSQENAELKARLKAAEEEANSTLMQAEAGTVGSTADTGKPAEGIDPKYAAIAKQLGLV